jgi:hypothetical protein
MLVGAVLYHRHRSESHKRLTTSAIIAMLPAHIERLPFALLQAGTAADPALGREHRSSWPCGLAHSVTVGPARFSSLIPATVRQDPGCTSAMQREVYDAPPDPDCGGVLDPGMCSTQLRRARSGSAQRLRRAQPGYAIKQVLDKRKPRALLADDGSVCRTSTERFTAPAVGKWINCDWKPS